MNKIKILQIELNKWAKSVGYELLTVDGIMGKKTQRAAQKTFWRIELLSGKVMQETDWTKSQSEIILHIDQIINVLKNVSKPRKINYIKTMSFGTVGVIPIGIGLLLLTYYMRG